MMELVTVGVDDFERVYPLLQLFNNRGMSKQDWRTMLFSYPWSNNPCRGYVTYADGEAVGFLGAIFSERQILGRGERFCNLSSWIVKPGSRGPSALMMRTLVEGLMDHTVVGYTPAPVTVKLFSLFGFTPFERELLLLPPLLTRRRDFSALRGSFTRSHAEIERALTGAELTIHRDHAHTRARGVLLRRGGRQCYVVARRVPYRRIPVAEVLYIGDLGFFWDNRALAQAAMLFATGAPVLGVDARFAHGFRTPRYLRSMYLPRIFRPAQSDITPMQIDGLYSELTMLRGVELSA